MSVASNMPASVENYNIEMARPSQTIADQDYMSMKSELVLEKLNLVYNTNGISRASTIVKAYQVPEHLRNIRSYTMATLKKSITIYLNVFHKFGEAEAANVIAKALESLSKKNHALKKVRNGEAMALAINFYTGAIATKNKDKNDAAFTKGDKNVYEGIKRGASIGLRMNNKLQLTEEDDAMRKKVGEQLDEIVWWMHKGFSYLLPYVGGCTRNAQWPDDFINFIRVGHVIMWTKHTSTNMGTKQTSWFKGRNVVLHIYSQTGRHIKQFSNVKQEDEVLFEPCTEILVCRKYKSGAKWHFDLREIKTGITDYATLWVDDMLLNKASRDNVYFLTKAWQRGAQRNMAFMLKKSTDVAMAYLRSEFFETSLKVCKRFVILSDCNRPEEKDGSVAGPRLMKNVKKILAGKSYPKKVQTCIYTSSLPALKTKLKKEGVDYNWIDLCTVNTSKALNFMFEAKYDT